MDTNLLRFKGKVKLKTEQDMEIEDQYDMGNIAKSAEWVWRERAVPVEEVYTIISFSKSKSIIQMYDNERILVDEPYSSLVDRWEELREGNPDKIGSHKDAEESVEDGGED